MYASFLGSCAPCIYTFLNNLMKSVFFNTFFRGEKRLASFMPSVPHSKYGRFPKQQRLITNK